jgi:hypothetical protein
MSSIWRRVALTFISISTSLSLWLPWGLSTRDTHDWAAALAPVFVPITGLVVLLVAFPVIANAEASFEPPVAGWKTHGYVFLAFLALTVLMAIGPRFLENIPEGLVSFFAPMALGWLIYSAALRWVRAKPGRIVPGTVAAAVLLVLIFVFVGSVG